MNILVVRVGRVGDTVMMTPALSALTHYYPDANITLLTSPAGKQLLKNFHPNITDIWSWQRSGLLKPYIDKASIKQKLHNPSEKFITLRTEDTETPEKGVAAIDVDTVFDACRQLLPGAN